MSNSNHLIFTPVWQADQNGVLWYTKIVHYGVAKWCISLYQNGAF
jgi:hypothetical protein